MNALTKTEDRPISVETLEHVLGTGDLSKLSVQQRVDYYLKVCDAIGVNPLTRPFRFMSFQGQTVLYATRDLTDQLRNLRKINITIVDKQLDAELFIVTARASTQDGRADEDVGAVPMSNQLKGDARANAIMKAMTKAKRRVTLSICGLGFLDESEVETLPGAQTYDADSERPVASIQTDHPKAAVYDTAPKPAAKRGRTIRDWLTELQADLVAIEAEGDLTTLMGRNDLKKALGPDGLKGGARDELDSMLAEAFERVRTVEAEPEKTEDEDDTFPGDRPLP